MEKFEIMKCCALCEFCIINLQDESLTLNDFCLPPLKGKFLHKCAENMKLINNDKQPTNCNEFLFNKDWKNQITYLDPKK